MRASLLALAKSIYNVYNPYFTESVPNMFTVNVRIGGKAKYIKFKYI